MSAAEIYLTENPPRHRPVTQVPAFNDDVVSWKFTFRKKLSELKALPKGWDGAGAKRINTHVAAYVETLAEGLGLSAAPQVVPLVSGGLQLEWHANGVSIEVAILKANVGEIYIEYLDSEEVIERELEEEDAELLAAIALASE